MTAVSVAAIATSIGMIYVPGTRTFPSGRFGGIVTASLLASTPLLWLQSQEAPASLAPLPFVVGWLLAVARFQSNGPIWWPAIAGAILGIGVYTSYASMVMMPLFLLLTIAVVVQARALSSHQVGAMVVSFCVAVSPLAEFLIRHPAAFRDTVNAFHLYDADRFNLRQGVHDMVSWVGLTARSEVYYDYFNPAFLFLTGRVLLFPLAVLVPAGIWQIASIETTPLARVSMSGFFLAPFAAALTAQAPIPRRILFITPFASIVAAYGLKRLLAWRRPGLAAGSERSSRLPRP